MNDRIQSIKLLLKENDYLHTMTYIKLTSIKPLITHGNEFNGEIKVLNRARHVNTCNGTTQEALVNK